MGTEVILDRDRDAAVINSTDVATDEVYSALQAQHPVVAMMCRWTQTLTAQSSGRMGGLLERDRYVTPGKTHDLMKMAQDAASSDDVVSTVGEMTESLAFSSMSFWCEDEDEEDVWNQWAADVDLDARFREMWRELYEVSQCYVAVWWGTRDYKVRGKTDAGVTRKRTFEGLQVPIALSLIDPLKVVPVGQTLFGQEQLAYVATRGEAAGFDRAIGNRSGIDPIVERLIVQKYDIPREEAAELREHGVDTTNLYLLNPANVFRHTATRPGYRRFAEVRMKSVLELLDMKHQLRQMDRAFLIAGTNFIVLIKQGSDDHPAKPEEIANLHAGVATLARVPVIIGDHRLSVEIITPKLDAVLSDKKYDVLDDRVRARLFQTFSPGNSEDDAKLATVVAAGMESRRKMMRRTFESKVIKPMFRRNTELQTPAELLFHPKKIALTFDANFAAFLLDLHEIGDLSRESILYQFDFDQDDEYRRRKREKKKYDDTFETVIPGAPAPGAAAPAGAPSPASNAAKKAAGRRTGGNKNGGGAAPGSGQGKPARNIRKQSDGSQETKRPKKRVAAELEPEADPVEDTHVEDEE